MVFILLVPGLVLFLVLLARGPAIENRAFRYFCHASSLLILSGFVLPPILGHCRKVGTTICDTGAGQFFANIGDWVSWSFFLLLPPFAYIFVLAISARDLGRLFTRGRRPVRAG